jgi:hypothetical protein
LAVTLLALERAGWQRAAWLAAWPQPDRAGPVGV